MILSDHTVKVWLYQKLVDMRKSFRGLIALVKNQLLEDPLSGHLFVFINRKRTLVKVLYFDRSGYCVWSKRLEQGRFHFRDDLGDKAVLDWTQLKLLLEGIEVKNTRRFKRYQHPQNRPITV
jgi:transposase